MKILRRVLALAFLAAAIAGRHASVTWLRICKPKAKQRDPKAAAFALKHNVPRADNVFALLQKIEAEDKETKS